jgi:hypothetical protein
MEEGRRRKERDEKWKEGGGGRNARTKNASRRRKVRGCTRQEAGARRKEHEGVVKPPFRLDGLHGLQGEVAGKFRQDGISVGEDFSKGPKISSKCWLSRHVGLIQTPPRMTSPTGWPSFRNASATPQEQ